MLVRQRRGSSPEIKLTMRPKRHITLKIPPILVKYDRYDLIIGRGHDLGWVGLLFKVDGKYKIKMGPRLCRAQLEPYKPMRDTDMEVDYEVTKDVLFIKLPPGAFELYNWWFRLPDVSDNPQKERGKIRDLQRVRSSDGGDDELSKYDGPIQ